MVFEPSAGVKDAWVVIHRPGVQVAQRGVASIEAFQMFLFEGRRS